MGMSDEKILKIGDNKEGIRWVLECQAELRAELITFYKKDLKEIFSALEGIGGKDDKNDFTSTIVDEARQCFIDHWKKSYDLVMPIDKTESVADMA